MKRSGRFVLLVTTACVGAFASPLAAQSGNAAAARGAPAAAEDVAGDGEIIVTARRREERLLDVPLSISALSGSDLTNRGAVNSEDYLRGIPGVNQSATSYNSGQSIVIRGIETVPSAQNFGIGPTYASYFGETPTTNSAGVTGGTSIDIKSVDINRVEVLRGPQGTSFGDASLGGAVRIIPNAPKLGRTEGRVAGAFSHTGGPGSSNYDLQSVINLPLGDMAAVRLVAYGSYESGHYRNRSGSDAAFQAGPVTQFQAQRSTGDKGNIGAVRTWGGRAALRFEPSDQLTLNLNALYQENHQNGVALANSGKFDQNLYRVDDRQVRRGQRYGFSDQYVGIVNPTAEYDLGWADLVASYSFMKSGSANAQAFGVFGSALPISQGQPSHHKEHVGELRVTTKLDGPINLVVGAFAERLTDDANISFYWLGSAATNSFTPGSLDKIGNADIVRRLTQKAVYGEAFAKPFDWLTLSAGARYYDYTRRFSDIRVGPFTGTSNFRGTVKSDGVNPRFSVSAKPSKDVLVYASYSQGFRLGTPQAQLPASRCDVNNDGLVDGTNVTLAETGRLSSDKIKSYEAGVKGSFLGGAVSADVAVFHMEWAGVPVRVLAPPPPTGCLLSYQANAGNAKSDGVEFSGAVKFGGGFRALAGVSYTNARIVDDVPSLGAMAGNQLPGSAKVNANLGLQYDFPIGGNSSYLRVDTIYVGSTYGDIVNRPSIKTSDYVKIDLSAGTTLKGLGVNLFVRNLFDEDTFASRGTSVNVPAFYGYRLRPRTLGIRLDYKFGG
ncbi:TonB-dependent receptor [Rhizorhabdus dicambivorans]|uniref:TonB-dependent receptor n=1 Tax=Rhizorhabdus dicambivorans TaxID=1850238 RepID=A0A2A4FUR5_9SPHN|nr:TonB-dependent receptor [Rhizorhabdus dicambivorans]ATE65775.1 TonB-dependent receptor [Rhizorhabdus dicambivorans]PCE41141.1 TonB-dependent receptor [Rhizorhabdus dicambivorans]